MDAIKKHLSGKSQEDFIFKGQKSYTGKPISIIQYSRIVKGWLTDLGYEDVSQYSTHSMRKSKASLIYEKTKNVDAVRRLLGQSSVTATSAYLGVTDESALDLARQYNMYPYLLMLLMICMYKTQIGTELKLVFCSN